MREARFILLSAHTVRQHDEIDGQASTSHAYKTHTLRTSACTQGHFQDGPIIIESPLMTSHELWHSLVTRHAGVEAQLPHLTTLCSPHIFCATVVAATRIHGKGEGTYKKGQLVL